MELSGVRNSWLILAKNGFWLAGGFGGSLACCNPLHRECAFGNIDCAGPKGQFAVQINGRDVEQHDPAHIGDSFLPVGRGLQLCHAFSVRRMA
ncbi:MAG: hypothetical protein IPH82_04340 [Chloroflexi bacterium]|nr:hypothetical protein [Chloroflexota bacterium]